MEEAVIPYELPEVDDHSFFFIAQRIAPSLEAKLHRHDAWELCCVTHGRGIRSAGDTQQPFSAGEVVLIPPQMAHCWSYAPESADVRGEISYLMAAFAHSSAEKCMDNLSILDGMEAVFLSGIHSHERNRILKYCVEKDIRAYVIPRIGDVLMSGAKRMHMFHLPILRVERYAPSPEYLFFKRFFDILLSLAALVLLSPVMLVTALAIRLTDGGPVFYRQCRLTRNGKKFNVLKFRSMRVDAERDGIARLSTGDKDPRITPVGGVIRKCRIDELPQLFNILGGSMSLVGPRPERPEIASQYEAQMPEFRLRLQAKAGLTGYAQVYGKYNTTPYDKLQMDLMYIANPGFKEDLRILLATVKVLFLPESTQGVAEGQVTAEQNSQKRMSEKWVD